MYLHAYVQAYILARMYKYMLACMYTYMLACMYTYMLACMYSPCITCTYWYWHERIHINRWKGSHGRIIERNKLCIYMYAYEPISTYRETGASGASCCGGRFLFVSAAYSYVFALVSESILWFFPVWISHHACVRVYAHARLNACGSLIRVWDPWLEPWVTVTVTDNLFKHELQKSPGSVTSTLGLTCDDTDSGNPSGPLWVEGKSR